MELKKPLSFKEQAIRLAEHGMSIDSISDAAAFLAGVNYYRLTGYALQFRASNGQDYIEGTSFEVVRNLYIFDQELRGILRNALEISEAMFRAQISNGFAMVKCTEPPYDGHYQISNFYRPQEYQEVLESLKQEEDRRSDSLVIQHHRTKYADQMPLWVIVELLSMSSLSKLYHAMYYSEQKVIADSCKKTIDVMSNHLHVLTVLRNKCCHGARLYNVEFRPSAKLGVSYLRNHPEVKTNTLFAAILVLFRSLPNRDAKVQLHSSLCGCIRRYASSVELKRMGFPENYSQLLNIELNALH